MRISSTLQLFGLVLLFASYLLPGHYFPWATFESQSLAALGVGLIGIGAAVIGLPAEQRVTWSVISLMAFATALVPLVQFSLGHITFLSDAVLPALYLCAFGLSMIVGQIWSRHGQVGWIDRLFSALSAAAVVSVAIAVLQWLSVDFAGVWVVALRPGGPPFANLGQPNHLATLLALGAIGLWRNYERGHIGGPISLIALGWLGLGVVMTQSRTGWLLVVLLVASWATMRRKAALRTSPVVVLTSAAVFVVAVLAWEPLNHVLLLSASQTLSERLQPGPRGLIWQAAFEAVLRSPWFGYGWNQVIVAQQAVAIDMPPVQRMFESAHNIVLDLALWAGVPLAMVWGATVVIWLKRQITNCSDVDSWSALVAIGVLLLHAQLEYPLEHLYFLLPLGLLIGAISESEIREAVALQQRAVMWSLLIPVACGLAALAVVTQEYLRVEQAHRDVRMMMARIGTDASRVVPPPDVRFLDAPREYHRLMITSSRSGMSDDELDWMRRVTVRHAFPPAMLRYALAAGLNDRPDEAVMTLRRLCSIHPPPRCDEASAGWRKAQLQWPELASVPFP